MKFWSGRGISGRSCALSDGDGHLLFLVLGRSVPARSATFWNRGAEDERSSHRLDGDGAGDRHRSGQHAGGASFGRQSGTRVGAAGVHFHGAILRRVVRSQIFLCGFRHCLIVSGVEQRPFHRAVERLSTAEERKRRKRPHDGDQQLLQHHRTAARFRHAVDHARSAACFTGQADPDFRYRDNGGDGLHCNAGPRFLSALYPLAGHAHVVQDPDCRSEQCAISRPGAAGGESHVARRWLSNQRVRTTFHSLHGLETVLRDESAALVFRACEIDSGGDQRPPRHGGIHPQSAQGIGRRPCGLHFRGRLYQPDWQHAAVQARARKDRRWFGRSSDSGSSGSFVGKHLQFRGWPVLLEMAEARAVSGDGFIWTCDAVVVDRARSAAGDSGIGERSCRASKEQGRPAASAIRPQCAKKLAQTCDGRFHRPRIEVWQKR